MKHLFDLHEKIIVITGAAGLLGAKHAEAVAEFGGRPILIDINQKKVKDLSKDLNKKYGKVSEFYKVDITKENQVKKNVKTLLSKFKHVDGLINNASINPNIKDFSKNKNLRIENFSLEDWNKSISVGLTGSFLCSKYYGKAISNNPNGGTIINISSDLGLIGPDQSLYEIKGLKKENQPVKPLVYSVVKSGLIGMTRYMSTYWPDKNVRVNAICPGGIEDGQSKNFIKKVSSKIPLARMARKEEYQATIIWMLSDASSYLNGSIVSVDGGRTSW
jgi:NAD(P)-dependent dehydrogenase (short-subunit alcohol dehydrogenase family)